MRYLVHSEDATFNSDTGRYEFNLTTRIPNPFRIRINQATFTAATASSYPQVVYLRSEKLAQVTRRKHTVELKNNGHEDSTDVLCAMQESHAVGRYHLQTRSGVTFPVHGHVPIRKLDFYFTNNRTAMPHSPASGASSGGSSNAAVTDADIEGIGATDLRAWFDLAPARLQTANFTNAENPGDLVHYVYSRSPAPANLLLSAAATNVQYEVYAMGSNAIGISRDSGSGLAQHISDTSFPTTTTAQEFHVHHLIKMHSTFTSTAGIFKCGDSRCRVQVNGGGSIKFVNSSNSNQVLQNLTWIPNKTYILSIWRKLTGSDDDGDGVNDPEFHWRFENLDSGAVQTEVTDSGLDFDETTETYWSYGVSGDYPRHLAGPLICVNGTDQTQYDNCISWLKNYYGGVDMSGSSSTPSSNVDATWFVELDIDARE